MPPRQMPPVQRGGFSLFRGPQPMQPFQSFPPFAGSPTSRPARGGGLLSRLFHRSGRMGNAAVHGMTGFERPASLIGPSPVQNLASPGTLNQFLANTQQVLNTAQQIGPMIQQYGPMIRNLPAMWRLYKGFKNASAEEDAESDSESLDQDSNENEENLEEEDDKKKESTSSHQTKRPRSQKSKKATTAKTEKRTGESVPKLYI